MPLNNQMQMKTTIISNAPMLNAYPDSIGGTLKDIAAFLDRSELSGVFQSFYILPSLFHSDLDRGFSVIDYGLNEQLASAEDLKKIREQGIELKLDFVLNHASVLSPQFQDVIAKGEESAYKDFFINWNDFWAGCGRMTADGYLQPDREYLEQMFFRKDGLPILSIRFPDGRKVPYWNTFYQEIRYSVPDPQEIMKAAGVRYDTAKQLAEIISEAAVAGKPAAEISFAEVCPAAVPEGAEGAAANDFQNFKKVSYEGKRIENAVKELLESGQKYLGQMDLNIKSPLVWEFYEETLKTLSGYGAKIVRLDAFAYAPKEPGARNFLNEPGTWELLEKVRVLAERYGLTLLPEIHAGYEEKIYEKIAAAGYLTYDFFLPGLIIDALEHNRGDTLAAWAGELAEKKIRTVNMLGCHDGIPLLDLKGMIPSERIQAIIDTVVQRGGAVKDLHGQKNIYYQINATYYSALGEDDRKLLLARALQLFMPGKPQIWYLDLFTGKNDDEAVKKAGAGGHKEINRTNLSVSRTEAELNREVVQKQLAMLRFRTAFPAFAFDSDFYVESRAAGMLWRWKKDGFTAELTVDLSNYSFQIVGRDVSDKAIYEMEM